MDKYEKWISCLGQRLKEERNKQGLSREKLAELANTEQGYIAQIENGNRVPSLRTFVNLLLVLGSSSYSPIFDDIENINHLEVSN